MLGPCFVMLYFVSFLYVVLPSSLCVREGVMLTFIVFLISCYCYRYRSLPLSRGPWVGIKPLNSVSWYFIKARLRLVLHGVKISAISLRFLLSADTFNQFGRRKGSTKRCAWPGSDPFSILIIIY